jgi:hypothetical protein
MTQEQKDLLKKVLCEMLPYGVKLYHADDYGDNIGKLESINISNDECVIWNYNGTDTDIFDIEICKPVLRSMSSLSEKEKDGLRDKNILIAISTSGTVETTIDGFDWLNKNMFDYRGLIEKGLALPAPEGMYNFKNL